MKYLFAYFPHTVMALKTEILRQKVRSFSF